MKMPPSESLMNRRSMLVLGLAGSAALTASGVLGQPMPGPPPPLRDETKLPAQARNMLSRIREAARSGEAAQLRIAIERNELPPVFERGARGHGVDILKRRSCDGEGREMLRILIAVLDQGFMTTGATAAPQQFIWPYFARTAFSALDPAARSASWSLVRLADIGLSVRDQQPLWHRLGIGADGTWHFFTSG